MFVRVCHYAGGKVYLSVKIYAVLLKYFQQVNTVMVVLINISNVFIQCRMIK